VTGEANVETARRLYEALAVFDKPTILEIFSPEFRGTLTPGMPPDLGGTYEGPDAMIAAWTRSAQNFLVVPAADRFMACGDDEVVVKGRYTGKVRATGNRFEAPFAHFLRFEDGRVVEFVQVADTALFAEALAD
jgi:ketosteroid isomerase-like protein